MKRRMNSGSSEERVGKIKIFKWQIDSDNNAQKELQSFHQREEKLVVPGKTSRTDCILSSGDAPRKKRTAFETKGGKAASERSLKRDDNNDDETDADNSQSLSPSGSATAIARDLPDPSVGKVSPDDFLLDLVKAQYGLKLEAKNALDMDSFFTEATEEQLASYTTEVVTAVRGNDLDELKRIKAEKGQMLNCTNRFGESLLNLSCRRGFESISKFLMEQPEVSVRICDDYGRTPLHDAMWHPSPQLKICTLIIQKDPSLLFLKDKRGFTTFQYARPEHWNVWRKFLFDNRDCLEGLTEPDILRRLQA